MKTLMMGLVLMAGWVSAAEVKPIATTEKIQAIDAKIADCTAKPAQVAAEQKAIYDKWIKACSSGMTAFLKERQERWDKQRAAEIVKLKATLVAQKTILQAVKDPNEVKPVEPIKEIVK